jgi:hypothetical protein
VICGLSKRIEKIDLDEVHKGKEILKAFICNKCKGIPRPNILECKNCDAIFCEECTIDEKNSSLLQM